MELLSNLLSSTNWVFVLIATVISMVVGMLWYGNMMFGRAYIKWMRLNPDHDKGMAMPLFWEFISRALYFIGLGWAFTVAPEGGPNSWICFAIIIWALFIFSTQISSVIWSNANHKVLWIIGSKMLFDTLVAVLLWYVIL